VIRRFTGAPMLAVLTELTASELDEAPNPEEEQLGESAAAAHPGGLVGA